MARLLGIDEKKAAHLFSGRTVVLKSQLAFDEAMQLQEKLENIGVISRVKDLSTRTEPQGHKSDDRLHDHTLHDITAAHFECPRCGHMQLETQHCARCGIDIHAAMKQKRKEDLIIEKKIRSLREQKQGPQVKQPTAAANDVEESAPVAEEPASKPSRLRRLFGGRS
jgi:ribosomal protein L37E